MDDVEYTEPIALRKVLNAREKRGSINKSHIRDFFTDLGLTITEEELDERIKRVDTDQKGEIDVNQFFDLILGELTIVDTEEEVVQAFQVFDKDDSGFIEAQDIRHVMTNLGDKLCNDEVDQFIKKSDLDGDGHINYEEFVRKMFERMRTHEEVFQQATQS